MIVADLGRARPRARGYARRVSTPEAVVDAGRSIPRRRLLVQQVAAPVRSFIATESGSAGLLLAATVAALIWVNAPFGDTYEEFWTTELSIRLGDHALYVPWAWLTWRSCFGHRATAGLFDDAYKLTALGKKQLVQEVADFDRLLVAIQRVMGTA